MRAPSQRGLLVRPELDVYWRERIGEKCVATTVCGQMAGRGSRLECHRMTVRVRHTRQRVLRLKAVANMVHSAATLALPRNANCRAPSWLFRMPKSGSTSGSRRRYACWASLVCIQAR